MPVADAAQRSKYAAAQYARDKEKKLLISAIRNVLLGKAPQPKVRERYGWSLADINKIRRRDAGFINVLDHKHKVGVERLQALYAALPGPLPDMKDDMVRVDRPPAKDPTPPFKQCLDEPSEKGNGAITWEQIVAFWSAGRIEKNNMGSNTVRKRLVQGQLVPELYAESTKRAKVTTFESLRRELAREEPSADAMPLLRDAERVMAWFRERYGKTKEKIAADVTQTGPAGAVAGGDGGEEVSSGPRRAEAVGIVSAAAQGTRRARAQAPELKAVTATYSNKLGDIISTYWGWGAFREALGSAALEKYRGGFGEGANAFMAAKEVAKETARNRTKSAAYAVPHYELLKETLPRIKRRLGASAQYLAAYLQVHLLGLRDNLGGVRVLDGEDGKVFRTDSPESDRDAWYRLDTGRLYISWFKTNQSKYGEPYDYKLPPYVRDEIEESLAAQPREWLVGVGRKPNGLPKPAGPAVQGAFKAVGFQYTIMKSKPTLGSPGPLEIRHSQVTWKHEQLRGKGKTEDEIAKDIARIFNHSADVNRDYIRLTFRSLDDPLARKGAESLKASRGGDPLPTEGGGETSGETPPNKPPTRPRSKRAVKPRVTVPAAVAPEKDTSGGQMVTRSGRAVRAPARNLA